MQTLNEKTILPDDPAMVARIAKALRREPDEIFESGRRIAWIAAIAEITGEKPNDIRNAIYECMRSTNAPFDVVMRAYLWAKPSTTRSVSCC